MISVMIPTRGRPEHLRQSINSLMNFAADPCSVELMFRFDDDADNDRAIAMLAGFPHEYECEIDIFIGKRFGYWGLHNYYNELCARSHGDFLLLWNDDMNIATPAWDQMLSDGPRFSVQQLRRDTAKTADLSVPCASRAVYESMGHFSLNAYNDMWMGQVGNEAGIIVIRDDIVFHHHCLEPEDRDLSRGDAITAEFKGPEQTALRARDVDAIRAAMSK